MTKSTLPGRIREAIAQAETKPDAIDYLISLIKEREANDPTRSLSDPVSFAAKREYGPGVVVFTEDELQNPRQTMDFARWVLGEEDVRGLYEGYGWRETIDHEMAHRLAALKMGAKATEIGLEIILAPDPETGELVPTLSNFFNATLGWETTAMAAVAVSLAPRTAVHDGGYGDALITRYYGFRGTVSEFGKLAIAHNSKLGPNEPQIILPPGIDWVDHPYDVHMEQVDKDLAGVL